MRPRDRALTCWRRSTPSPSRASLSIATQSASGPRCSSGATRSVRDLAGSPQVWSDRVSWQYVPMKSPRKRYGAAGDLATGSTAPRADAPLSIAAAIGVQIRQLRKRQEITAAELAHQAGLSAG